MHPLSMHTDSSTPFGVAEYSIDEPLIASGSIEILSLRDSGMFSYTNKINLTDHDENMRRKR